MVNAIQMEVSSRQTDGTYNRTDTQGDACLTRIYALLRAARGVPK
jgi:hypothetical protein